jgi:alpha-tubulin suppressor-like RCC1 family protein
VTYQVYAIDDHAAAGISNQFVARAGAVAKYVVIPHVNDPPAGAEVVIAAWAADAHGNPTSTDAVLVHWSMTGSGGSLNFATTPTDEGVATVYLKTATVPGTTYTVSASDAGGNTGTSPAITTLPQISLASMSVVMGPSSSCGIAMDGNAWCWGANAAGGLGNGTTFDRGLPGRVRGNYSMTSLSAGAAHTCGVAAGAVLCWGNNDAGQLGNGSVAVSLVPTPINTSLTFTAVSAGASHTCAVATAGDAYCWGSRSAGLGDGGGAGTSTLTPVKVTGGLSFTVVSTGVDHSCGITTAGDAYCWGSNTRGKLGDGSSGLQATAPNIVAGGHKFTSISVGEQHSCGISGGAVYCWGDHSYGQLGTGSSQGATNTPAQIVSALTFVAVSAGGFHTCAIASDGKAYCWGDNSNGELGDGGAVFQTYRALPTAVSGGLTFKSIAVGGGLIGGDYYYYYSSPGGHSCGVTTGGVTYCWGSNLLGELGISPAGGDTSTPTKVSGQP